MKEKFFILPFAFFFLSRPEASGVREAKAAKFIGESNLNCNHIGVYGWYLLLLGPGMALHEKV
jgi:hypothetical protein